MLILPPPTTQRSVPVDPLRAFLQERMRRPQRHRLLHGFPLAAAMQARPADIDLDVRPRKNRGLLVGVLPHPYCNPTVAGCGFCTFAHQQHRNDRAGEVIEHVVAEIQNRVDAQPAHLFDRQVDALYFGGGTANLSPAEPFRKLCRTLAEAFDLRDAEVTLEGVPAYFVKRRPLLLDVMREELPARHFRISMGIQTFDPERLRRMGRQAFGDVGTFMDVVEAAHDRGFTVSADFLYDLPHQSPAEMRRDVDRADALGLDHLGLYHLVLFRGLGTAWAQDPEMLAGLPDNETAADNWQDLRDRLRRAGWEQTTLTNFERKAFQGNANRFVYEEYGFQVDRYDALGFGPGGISFAADADFRGGLKLLNPDKAEDYCAAVRQGQAPWDRFFRYEEADLRVLYLIRRLAALKIDPQEYRRLFASDLRRDFAGEIRLLAEEGLLVDGNDRLEPTPRGMFYGDTIASLFAQRRSDVLRGRLREKTALADRAAEFAFDNGYGNM